MFCEIQLCNLRSKTHGFGRYLSRLIAFSSPLFSCLHCFLVSIVLLSPLLSRLHCFLVSIVFSSPLLLVSIVFLSPLLSCLHCFPVSIAFSFPLCMETAELATALPWGVLRLSVHSAGCVCILRLRRAFLLRLFFARSRWAGRTQKSENSLR